MALAVDLDAELGAVAVKIERVGAEWMLSADVRPVEMTRLDFPPEQHFGQGHLAPQLAGSGH
jgi:hypothetical protein